MSISPFPDDRPDDDFDSDVEEVLGQQRTKTARKSTKDAITDIHQLISTEPLEYSYFQNSLISMWRGPAHWKIKPISKCKYHLTSQHHKKYIKI